MSYSFTWSPITSALGKLQLLYRWWVDGWSWAAAYVTYWPLVLGYVVDGTMFLVVKRLWLCAALEVNMKAQSYRSMLSCDRSYWQAGCDWLYAQSQPITAGLSSNTSYYLFIIYNSLLGYTSCLFELYYECIRVIAQRQTDHAFDPFWCVKLCNDTWIVQWTCDLLFLLALSMEKQVWHSLE